MLCPAVVNAVLRSPPSPVYGTTFFKILRTNQLSAKSPPSNGALPQVRCAAAYTPGYTPQSRAHPTFPTATKPSPPHNFTTATTSSTRVSSASGESEEACDVGTGRSRKHMHVPMRECVRGRPACERTDSRGLPPRARLGVTAFA